MTAEVPTRLFSEQQWHQLLPLLNSLDQSQRLWLSGYLVAPDWRAETVAVVADAAERVTIAYGTETDNCKRLAHQLEARCREAGIAAEVVDLAQTRARRLARMKYLVVITATHGDGDPPEPITDFYDNLTADDMTPLKGLRFAVLALGDSTYENYCVTGQIIDQRLEALGGERLIPRRDCDVDFAQPADEWMTQLLPTLPTATATATATSPGHAAPLATVSQATYSKDSPLEVEVLANNNLSHAHRPDPIHHLELELPVADFPLVPGDAVGILPENPPQLVATVLDATGLSGEAPVVLNDAAMPLVEALRKHRDLTIPSRGFLAAWAALSGDSWLGEINSADAKAQREFLRQHQVCDLIRRAPARPEPQALVDALRPQQPRLYDLANSLAVNEDELHLTVKAYSYPFGEREETGITSASLLDLQPGDSLRIYPHRNARFQLPESSPESPGAPLVLIAEGTGIAPYRAFLQALAQRDTAPPCWLVFAEEHFEEDFLYQTDLQKALAEGVLTHLDTVFYGDEPQRQLATPLLDSAARLEDWLGKGAHIYLCGEKDSLDACEAQLQEHLDGTQGAGFWKQLSKGKRVHRNLY